MVSESTNSGLVAALALTVNGNIDVATSKASTNDKNFTVLFLVITFNVTPFLNSVDFSDIYAYHFFL